MKFYDIPGLDNYQISKSGVVRSKDRIITDSLNVKRLIKSKVISKSMSTTGYPTVAIAARSKFIHRLLAITFIPNPDNKPEVNHINGIKTDFSLSNLEWVTRTENQRHSWKHLNRVGTWKGKSGFDHHAGKPVNQYDESGNLIKRFGSLSDAAKSNGWYHYRVQWAIEKRAGLIDGYKFVLC